MSISEAEALIQQQALAIDLLQERLTTLEMAIPELGIGWERISRMALTWFMHML